MSLSTRIAPFLPYLRRYSRALTGSQTSGDAYVAAVLEALIADVTIFPEASSDRVALFRLYTELFGSSSVLIPEPVSPFAWEKRASINLASVSPLARQAFLLVSVEGFRTSEAAEVLGTTESGMNELLERASEEISRQVATDIMIIEDEPLIAIDIEQMVESLGHRVTGIARTRDEAVALFKATRPSMVLADIQLADGSSGIDAVNDILKNTSIPVIFITAFPERLLTGERPEPTFLVTKPFNPDMVKALISQALFFNESTKAAA
ncbi:response regulator [Rhizobium giardinii]|uniref:DNA-directed RNA polymerase specialized sigma24 family protein n=1 Tax=Rhizobium giardinii TaxID=56731 RepID=A0A7W8U7R6_9HYPH|nr:response regulator [Rhizobium giardinii]MBB5534406.1 DNA-directed RNA polymerase specialized sigma24 family protein [Rhizobium giardinii]